MTFSVVDQAAPLLRQGFRMMSRAVAYTPHEGTEAGVRASLTGRGVAELFAAAQQRDLVGTLDVEEFRTAFGAAATPRRFDRLVAMGATYTVQEWRGAPHDAAPVFFKVLLRGGTQ